MNDRAVRIEKAGASAGPGPGEREAPPLERLFIALPLPDWVRSDLEGLEEPMRGVAWARRPQLHLTLRFIGDTPTDRAQRIEASLAAIRVESFILPIEGVGVFPPKGPPKVIWVGVGSGHPHLFQLRQRMDDAVLAAGSDLDVRHFQPHVTIARCGDASAAAVSAWLRRHAGFAAAPFRVTAFDLCSSRLTPQGAEHSLKRRYPLA